MQEESHSPTEFIKALSERIGGEIPDLTISRPTLEDIYLSMIGESNE
jgi:ABC-2 type transport system ATP-binding protein